MKVENIWFNNNKDFNPIDNVASLVTYYNYLHKELMENDKNFIAQSILGLENYKELDAWLGKSHN